jgi:hypothetical protein
MDVFPLAFLPSLYYCQKIIQSSHPVIDLGEHYVKQTCRNRFQILTSQGVQALTIPVKKGLLNHIPMREVEISYHENWQKKYWQAIETAYRNAPYFEHYSVDFYEIWFDKHILLSELSIKINHWLLRELRVDKHIDFSDAYVDNQHIINDYRKHDFLQKSFHLMPYKQVFSYKLNFEFRVSALDLLMNKGAESGFILH